MNRCEHDKNISNAGDSVRVAIMYCILAVLAFFSIFGLVLTLGNNLNKDMNFPPKNNNHDYHNAFGIDVAKHKTLIPLADAILSDGLISNSEWIYLKDKWDYLEQNNENVESLSEQQNSLNSVVY